MKWIQKTRLDSHIHVREDSEKDFNRLARLLTGNSASLVLSGSGAHGFAHIGAIRAMEEAGLQIDQIGGTSMGALLAAQHAMGWDSNTMLERSKDAIKRHYKMDYTLPVVSLLTGKSWGDFLEMLFGDMQIEDLWLNYFCCASSLTDAKLKVFDSGSLSKYVRASSAIPGIVPPIYDNGGLIVDGALLNNLPVNIMQDRNSGGSIYAVDMGDGLDNSHQKPFDPVQSGWRLAFGSKKDKPGIPNIMSILIQSATMGSQMTQEKARNMVGLYIKPDVHSYSMLDIKDIDAIVEAGYKAATVEIEQWLNEKPQQ
ncbi:MAG: patatin-like phospholipase family protein [Cycloclasticus sp.]